MLMEQVTFEGYKQAVLKKFKEVQQLDRTSLLLNMTPASIRKYCQLLASEKLNADDEKTFRAYFNISSEGDMVNGIENFGLGKMKSLISFLNSEKDSHNSLRTELAAVLGNFKPRPYSHFLKKHGAVSYDSTEIATRFVDLEEVSTEIAEPKSGEISSTINRHITRNKLYLGGLVLVLLFISVLAFKKVLKPDCLQWADDHFEIVDCDGNKQGFVYSAPKLQYDERILDFRKIEVSDSTTFFKNGFPVVWYLKKNGKCEFFNAPGIHPVYDKPLKPVTQYIVNKYVVEEK